MNTKGLEALNSISLDETLQIPDEQYTKLLEKYKQTSFLQTILNGLKRII